MGRRTLLLISALLIAALGTTLVWLYVRGADGRAQAGAKKITVYVVRDMIDPPLTLAQALDKATPLQIEALALPSDPITATDRATKGSQALLTHLVPGQVLTKSMFGSQVDAAVTTGLARNRYAIEVSLADPNRVAGLLQPGSLITIFETFPKGDGTDLTRPLLWDITVLSGGSAPTVNQGARSATAGVPQAIVALQVTEEQAAQIIHTQSTQKKITLWFALQGPDVKPGPNATADFNTVRGGVGP